MPLPDTSFTATGGCSCGVIRYRINIPEASSRLLSPFEPPSNADRMPRTISCHCNDCRRAAASALPVALIQIPSPLLTVSVLSPSADEPIHATGRFVDVLSPDYDAAAADASRPPYVSAMDILRTDDERKPNDWLRFFHSVKCGREHNRCFCGRCGTQLSYHLALTPEFCHEGQLPAGYADLFDISMGTLDREFLDKDWFNPTCELHFKLGTLLSRGVSLTAKPLKDVVKLKDEIEPVGDKELKELAAL